jgi:hypothetical protein
MAATNLISQSVAVRRVQPLVLEEQRFQHRAEQRKEMVQTTQVLRNVEKQKRFHSVPATTKRV